MKMNSIVVAGALSLAAVSLASAQQYVYMTGSTAFRGITYATLNSTAVFDAAPTYVGFNGSSAGGANFMVFSNTISGTPTIIKCHWSGSEGGITDVSTSQQETFLDDSVIPGGSQLGVTPSGSQLTTNGVDLALADNALSFSKTPNSTASQSFVGALPFVFVKNTNSLPAVSNLTNVTDQQFRKNAAGGVKLALYTGIAADVNNYVYISGRDDNSGTRVNTFGITGLGIKAAPQQIELDNNGNMIQPDPINFPGIYTTAQGFSSGGTLANTFGGDTGNKADQVNVGKTGFAVIAYFGRADANTAISKGGVELAYNGVKESPAAIEEGQYAFWGNEYLLKRSGASPQAGTVFSSLVAATGIPANCDAVVAFSTTQMHALRGGPTTDPSHK